MSSIAALLADHLSPNAIVPWGAVEPALQAQLTQAITPDDTQPDCVVYPTSQEELAAVMALAHQHRWPLLPCGSGSKLHWGGLAQGVRLVVSTARYQRLLEHAVGDLTVTAEAGMRVADLQATLAQQGQFLAIDPAYPDRATLGGIVATANAGSWRQRYGGIRDMLIGIQLIRQDGAVAKAGGRVVKNVAGYDLMKLFTGSYGSLGLISQLTFRIYPLPPAARTVVLTGDRAALSQATAALLASGLTPTAIDLLQSSTPFPAIEELQSPSSSEPPLYLLSRFQSIDIGVEKQADTLLQLGNTLGLRGTCLTATDDAHLWQQLREAMDGSPASGAITGKIGVLPSQAVATLTTLSRLLPGLEQVVIHAGSGLGLIRVNPADTAIASLVEQLQKGREWCQGQSGFLTILEAPRSLKQTIEGWGYPGNAIELMRGIKRQFDPHALLSPKRFLSL